MIDVTCAIIRNDEGDILLVQRSGDSDHPFKWEFPGGKVKEEESDEDSIIREIEEELAMSIVISGVGTPVIHDYGIKKIRLIPFICDTLSEPVLTEHIDFSWVSPDSLTGVDLCEADIKIAANYAGKVSPGSSNKKADSAGNTNLKEELRILVEGIFSVGAVDIVAAVSEEDEEAIDILFEFSNATSDRFAFHSSWALTKICEKRPAVSKYLAGRMVQTLPGTTQNGVVRSYLKILSEMPMADIDESQHGYFVEYCFSALVSGASDVAHKAYAMGALLKLTHLYPDLANELRAAVMVAMEEGSAGIKARGHQVLNELSKIQST